MVKGSMYDPFVTMDVNEFGIRTPIKINPQGLVLDGRKRLGAAIALGYSKVPVIIEDSVTRNFRIGQIAWFRDTVVIKISNKEWSTLDTCGTQYVIQESDIQLPRSTILKSLVCVDTLITAIPKVSKHNISTTRITHDSKPLHQFPKGSVLRKKQGTNIYVMASVTEGFCNMLNVATGKIEPSDSNKFGVSQSITNIFTE